MDFKMPKVKKKATLKSQMQGLIETMDQDVVGSDEYMEQLDKLEKIAKVDSLIKSKQEANKNSLNWNTVLVVVGGIAEIVIIMEHERLHNFGTKAFGRILRPKLP